MPVMPAREPGPVTVAGKRLQRPRHICCFFDSSEQEDAAVLPYLAEGIANGEKIISIRDSDALPEHIGRLAAGGIDVDAGQRSGQLCTACSADTYLAGGRFSKERMFGSLKEELERIAAGPFTRLRTCGDMRWALRSMPSMAEVLEYESDVNALLDDHDAAFMCVYDANRVSGRALLDILSTHPQVMIGNHVHENPYYMSPAEYRRTLMARRAASTALTSEATSLGNDRPGPSPAPR